MDSLDIRNLYAAYRSVYEDQQSLTEEVDVELDEELTGRRKTAAIKKFNRQNETPGKPNYTLASASTHRQGSPNPHNPSTAEDGADSGNRPTKRGGSGVKGKAKTGYYAGDRELDRGSGNAARRRMQNEEVDIYDLVLDHLLDEGYCDDVESAEVVMANMSEEWLDEILDEAKVVMSVKSPEGKERRLNTTKASSRAVDLRDPRNPEAFKRGKEAMNTMAQQKVDRRSVAIRDRLIKRHRLSPNVN